MNKFKLQIFYSQIYYDLDKYLVSQISGASELSRYTVLYTTSMSAVFFFCLIRQTTTMIRPIRSAPPAQPSPMTRPLLFVGVGVGEGEGNTSEPVVRAVELRRVEFSAFWAVYI